MNSRSDAADIRSPFAIASLALANRLVQAPMAGVATRAFRLQARRFGVGLVVTEMIGSYGVYYRNPRTLAMLAAAPEERPLLVQLFGARPEVMAAAAARAVEAGADAVDINMGCPVRKVMKTGAGAALMADGRLAVRVTAAVVAAAAPVPVTVKLRSGPAAEVTVHSLAPRLVEAGAAAICIHPRLAVEGRKGRADHRVTAALAEALAVPVIASGDVDGPERAAWLLSECGAAAVMVGRASLGNPWIFADILAGERPRRRPLVEVLAEMEVFDGDLCAEMGEERAGRFMRKFYGWYLRPFRPGSELMRALFTAADFQEAARLLVEAMPEAAGYQPRA